MWPTKVIFALRPCNPIFLLHVPFSLLSILCVPMSDPSSLLPSFLPLKGVGRVLGPTGLRQDVVYVADIPPAGLWHGRVEATVLSRQKSREYCQSKSGGCGEPKATMKH